VTPEQIETAEAPPSGAFSLGESDENYCRVVTKLNPSWRVIECRDRVQWILQRRIRPETVVRATFRNRGYFRTREVLTRSIKALKIDPATLNGLPDWLEGDLGPIPTLRYGRHTRVAQ
jgi:hypothetical protein